MKAILALIDFSDVMDAVVTAAADIARAFKAKLIFLYVASPDADYEGDEMRTDVSRESVAAEMHRYHHTLRGIECDCRAAGIDATAILVRSAGRSPVRKILQEITRVRPDLIVVGSHGHGLIHDLLLGSVSSAAVRKASCRVLVVPSRKRLPRAKWRVRSK